MTLKTTISIMTFAGSILLAGCDGGSGSAGNNPFLASTYNTPFNVPPFDKIKPEHFMPAFKEGMKLQLENIDKIVKQADAPTFSNTVEALENSKELLTRVSTVFFNLTSANTSPELEAINKDVSPMLARHNDDIYMNAALFTRVKAVYDQQDKFNLDSEQKKLLKDMYKDFIRSGINLESTKQSRLREINKELSTLTVKFGQNLLAENNRFELIIDNKDDLSGLPESSIAAAQSAKEKGIEGKWRFTLHNSSALPFLQYADNRALREKIYTAYITKCNHGDSLDNNATIASIASLRAEKAQLLGYTNHAAYVLEEAMSEKPDNVNKLLAELWKPAITVAKKEALEMQALMDKAGKGEKLEAWDWQYYAEKVRKEKFNLDAEAVRPYFKLENVRDGIFTLCNKLYGVSFTEVKDIPRYHPDVVAYEVKDADGKTSLGLVYMDFHSRASKRSGAWMTSYRKESIENGKRIAPVISIVCNFTNASGDKPALLTADEVETFFHEFGHSLHGMLASTQYYSLSGTAVPRDFVELPSQVMENWAFEPEMLALYAKHYKTGEIIPADLVNKIKAASKFNQGFATVEYLAASILDMGYHTLSGKEKIDPPAFEKMTMDKLGIIPQIAPRYRSTYFQHIFSGGYSAGYYSYIWAEVLDSDAFAAFKESGNIFNKEIAASFRKNILERGGTAEPMDMYKAFRGKEPDLKYLLEKRGLNTTPLNDSRALK